MLRDSIPSTGLPLPFISAGSTSFLVFMSAIGVVLNVDRESREKFCYIKTSKNSYKQIKNACEIVCVFLFGL
ncbi:MAG: FtsW/RodA/SpoVE family cell cycle protein [Candidatus Onthoplasma sp.]